MKISNVLSLPYFTYPSQPILDKTENKLYLVARNSSSIVITENLLTIDLSTFQVSSISYLSALSSLGVSFNCSNTPDLTIECSVRSAVQIGLKILLY